MENLKKHWIETCSKYCHDPVIIDQCFNLLVSAYGEKQRHYHNMDHIGSMLSEIESHKGMLMNADLLNFAAWFHDVVYNPKKKDNENKSAELAEKILKQLRVPAEMILKIKQYIIATANHMDKSIDSDTDLAFFLDCDLKVLGDERVNYNRYAEQIRKEYRHVPSLIYAFERKKVLKRFIESPGIYRTKYFRDKYEQQARANILHEIQNL